MKRNRWTPFVFTVLLLAFVVPSLAQTPSLNNTKIDGYRAIWFILGQPYEYGDKNSGSTGTYTCKHIPIAVHAPEANKTFFVFGGTPAADRRHLLCMIGCYDHATDTVGKPTVVHDKQGVDDPHDNPTLLIDPEGYLWVYVAGRARQRMGYKYRSVKPYDIESFERITEEEMCYPQPKYVAGKGVLNLFTKYLGNRLLFFETSPDGVTWTEDIPLVAMKRENDRRSGHYQISGRHGEKIAFFFNWHPNGNVDRRTNIYYMQTTDFGKTWTDIRGVEVAIPVVDVNSPVLAREFFSREKNVYIKDIAFDENGNPMALYLSGTGHEPGPRKGPREWAVLYWNGKEWENHRITCSDQNYDSGSIWATPEKWTVVAPTINRPQQWGAGGEIVQWESRDKGKTWKPVRQITDNSPRNHNYVRKVVDGKAPFRFLWADGNPDAFSKSQLYFGDFDGNVRILPYDMTEKRQKPEKYEPVEWKCPLSTADRKTGKIVHPFQSTAPLTRCVP